MENYLSEIRHLTRNTLSKQDYNLLLIADEDIFDVESNIVNQVAMILIVDWYHNYGPSKQPLNRYLNQDGDRSESEVKMYQRASQTLRAKNADLRERHRPYTDGLPDTFAMESKHKGIPLSPANFETVMNHTADSPNICQLLKDIENKRCMRLSNKEFYSEAKAYEEWVSDKIAASEISAEDFLKHSIDYFCLQEKFHVDLIFELAKYMDEHQKKQLAFERMEPFWMNMNISYPRGRIEANQVLYYRRAIPYACSKSENQFRQMAGKWKYLREMQAIIVNKAKMNQIQDQLTPEIAEQFIRTHYNVLQNHIRCDFGPRNEPNKTRMRLARNIMKQMFGDDQVSQVRKQ